MTSGTYKALVTEHEHKPAHQRFRWILTNENNTIVRAGHCASQEEVDQVIKENLLKLPQGTLQTATPEAPVRKPRSKKS